MNWLVSFGGEESHFNAIPYKKDRVIDQLAFVVKKL